MAEAVAPSMSKDYSQALVALSIEDNIGTCGTACYRGVPAHIEDILTGPNSHAFRYLVEPLGLRSCWSMPYFNADGTVHGTFALYSRQPRLPSEFESRCPALGRGLPSVNHCDDLQGYLLVRPMPSADVWELLSRTSLSKKDNGPQSGLPWRTVAGRQR